MVLALLCFTAVSWAQQSAVQLILDPAHVGIQGIVRPGTWTPMRITMDNTNGTTLSVVVSWSLQDMDKDQVLAQRQTTLTAGRKQNLWLYAVPPLHTKATDLWTVTVRDQATGQLIVTSQIPIITKAPTTMSLIASTGSRTRLGLDAYTQKIGDADQFPYTQHEPIHVVRGFSPAMIPDRWYGLSALNMLVWTADSLDPGSPAISAQSLIALQKWVEAGGHLVVSLPAVGELWTSSPLADLLPAVKLKLVENQLPPPVLGLLARSVGIDMLSLTPKAGEDIAILAKDVNENFPVIVSQQRGFGRVTLLGFDLTNRDLRDMGLPNGSKFWKTICKWQSPALGSKRITYRVDKKQMMSIFNHRGVNLSGMVGPQVAMRGTYNTALLVAMLTFACYWLISGPVSFFVLKHKSRERYAWSAFVLAVIVFSAISWSSAMVFRPTQTRVEHFSILDIDATQKIVRTSSWLSLFVAKHGKVELQIADNTGSSSNQHLIAAPGFPPVQTGSGFLDPQRYSFQCNAPGKIEIPFRATAKQLALNWQAGFADPMPQGYHANQFIQGQIKLVRNFPVGTLTHRFKSPLQAALFVYCPGGSKTPWVWREKENWQPGVPLTVSPVRIQTMDRLLAPPMRSASNDWSGYLWTLQHGNKSLRRLLQPDNPNLKLASNEIRTGIEMLSFYDMLPPPTYWTETSIANTSWPMHYLRSLGRDLDWTKLTEFPRLIVIGYMRNAQLPIPLNVDGVAVESKGRVAVRWMMHLSPQTQNPIQHPDDLSDLQPQTGN